MDLILSIPERASLKQIVSYRWDSPTYSTVLMPLKLEFICAAEEYVYFFYTGGISDTWTSQIPGR